MTSDGDGAAGESDPTGNGAPTADRFETLREEVDEVAFDVLLEDPEYVAFLDEIGERDWGRVRHGERSGAGRRDAGSIRRTGNGRRTARETGADRRGRGDGPGTGTDDAGEVPADDGGSSEAVTDDPTR